VTDRGAEVRTRVQAELLTVPPALARLSADDQLALRDLMRRAHEPDPGSQPAVAER
jgi:hypothetical protein